MKGSEIRSAFLRFFEEKGHTVVPSSSLVPQDDPTILFSNAGMNQFKNAFLGAEKRPYSRAASCQKCLRISGKHNDLENVGVTARHHTFFEMLGNFSFGDYFKKEAIQFAWEFVTERLQLPKERLWVTVFEKDDEAAELWIKHTDVRRERVLRMGEKDNFWSMGDTGPCGPCSEIFYYLGDDVAGQSEEEFRKDDGTYIEIWNLVFMQFDRDASGTLTALPKPSVDTGMGLDRVASVMQKASGTYGCDLVRPIIATCEQLSNLRYDGRSYEVRDLRTDRAYAQDVAMRVIADHTRAAVFMVADGVMPSNDGRGYVLRRLIRRAVRHGRVLEFSQPFFSATAATAIEIFQDAYPYLLERKAHIQRVLEAEEIKFHETLDAGLGILRKEVEKLGSAKLLPGDVAFLLHDTYGFPLDLTQDALKEYNVQVDIAGFNAAMAAQRSRSREDRKSQGISYQAIALEGPKTTFIGYECLTAESQVLQVVPGDSPQRVNLLVETTPFYAESGGQVGDTGTISVDGATLEVLDTQKVQDGYFLHLCEVKSGSVSNALVGKTVRLEVDAERRRAIRAHHSATHLVHWALRTVLGEHVKQAGSRLDGQGSRFDYSHFEPVTDEQLQRIEQLVNEQILANHEVVIREMAIDEARKLGAMALFGEKYGDVVRVVQIGPHSIELCGGTHVARSGEIGLCLITGDGGVSAGVRRIEFRCGKAALEEVERERRALRQIASLLKGDASHVAEKVERVLQRNKQLEREVEQLKSAVANARSADLVSEARTSASGVKVVAAEVNAADTDTLRTMVDRLRLKLGSGVVALAARTTDQVVLVAGVTPDLVGKVKAGVLVKEAAQAAGGRGGGRPDFAQAGGIDPSRINVALEKVLELVG